MSKKKEILEIIFEDDSIVVINKLAGILSIPDRFRLELANLKTELLMTRTEIIPVHRLDKYTSGVILFAKNAETHRLLNKQFQERKVEKKYWALTQGIPTPATGTINKSIAADKSRSGKMKISRQGKQAISHYKVLRQFGDIALVEVAIDTGRTHQIRVHMKSIGHPLLVDKDYGEQEGWYLSTLKKKKFRKGKEAEEKPLLGRLSLHAKTLSITHPQTKGSMTFEADLPKDLRATLKQLEKWYGNR